MTTTLEEELEQAARRADQLARMIGVAYFAATEPLAESRRLRQRAAWVRELGQRAEDQGMLASYDEGFSAAIRSLTGPIPSETAPAAEPDKWLIAAAHLSTEGVTYFWGPNFSGYTADLSKAGRYTEQEAKSREKWTERMEVAVSLAEAEAAKFPAVRDDDGHRWFHRRFPGPKSSYEGDGTAPTTAPAAPKEGMVKP